MREPRRGLARETEPRGWTRLGDQVATLVSTVGLERSARLVAVALVPVFLGAEGVARFVPLYTALIVYVLVTSFAPRNQYLRGADLAVAAALIVATGGEVMAFLPFLMVAVAGPGAHGGIVAGLAAGGTMTVVLLTVLLAGERLEVLGSSQLLPVALLLPLTGVTMAAATQVRADEQARDRRMLQEANRLLGALRSIADELPGGLDVTTVTAAMVADARDLPGVGAALVYADDDGVLKPVATHGLSPGEVPTLRVDQLRETARAGRARLRSLSMLPSELQPACQGHRWWVVTGMEREGTLVGTLLVGVDDPDAGRAARPRLEALADDGAVAIQNAQLFDHTRERAAQAARDHLAGELHDGVAQALTHLRMELELQSLATEGDTAEELTRLAGVAGNAQDDLRSTISGLRSAGAGDLAQAIRRHIDYLTKPHGPAIAFDHDGDARLDAVTSHEVLRILQEAISNAVRHGRGREVSVWLTCDEERLRLVVEDDGEGFDTGVRPHAGSVGLRSMHNRAHRLGGRLVISSEPHRGTRIDLRCPLPRRGGEAPAPEESPPTRASGPDAEDGAPPPAADGPAEHGPVPPHGQDAPGASSSALPSRRSP